MIKLLKGNCLDLLRQLEPGCADLVLIDPPYSSGGLFAGDRKQDTRVKYTDADFNGAARFPSFSGDNMDQHSFIQFMTHVSMELRELTKEGGTGVACVQEGRNFIGIELGDQYFDMATKRIQEAEDELLNDF